MKRSALCSKQSFREMLILCLQQLPRCLRRNFLSCSKIIWAVLILTKSMKESEGLRRKLRPVIRFWLFIFGQNSLVERKSSNFFTLPFLFYYRQRNCLPFWRHLLSDHMELCKYWRPSVTAAQNGHCYIEKIFVKGMYQLRVC